MHHRFTIFVVSLALVSAFASGCGRRRPAETPLGVVPSDEAINVMAVNARTRGCVTDQLPRGGFHIRCASLEDPAVTVTLGTGADETGDNFNWTCVDGPTREAECRALYDVLRQSPNAGGEASSDTPAAEAPAAEAPEGDAAE